MVDRKALQDLEDTIGEPDFVPRLVRLFLESAPQMLADVKAQHAKGDPVAMGHAAHAITSNARSLGAIALADLTSRLDHLGRAGSMENADQLIQEMLATFDKTKVAYEEFLRAK